MIENPGKLKLCGYIYIGPNAFWSAHGGIEIGNNVVFGPRTTIWSSSHDYKSNRMLPYGKPDIMKCVIVKDNVWIGDQVMILPGVTINEGAVIAAGSVVTKDVPATWIVGGNPARQIGQRSQEVYQMLKSGKRLHQVIKHVGDEDE